MSQHQHLFLSERMKAPQTAPRRRHLRPNVVFLKRYKTHRTCACAQLSSPPCVARAHLFFRGSCAFFFCLYRFCFSCCDCLVLFYTLSPTRCHCGASDRRGQHRTSASSSSSGSKQQQMRSCQFFFNFALA